MSKRSAIETDQTPVSDGRHSKRQRVENISEGKRKPLASSSEPIVSARQLQRLLTFQQGAAAELRSGIQSFKTLLDAILYSTDDSEKPRQQAILREYLELQRLKDSAESDAIFLPDLIQTWAYATETNFEQLLSAVTALLALLLKVLSRELEFREYGISLCKTILQQSQVKLFGRSLSIHSNKEFIISPSLRLLTEVVSFDGGLLARQVYAKREYTFDARTLARNLGLWKASSEHNAEESRKPSVRSNAVRYLLAHLKYQDEGGKSDILKQGNVLRALFEHINTDPPALAVELLDVVKNHVMLDKSISRKSKSYVLAERNLTSIARLYKSQPADEPPSELRKLPDAAAHEFLLLVCTSPEMGIMLPSFGWYPPGMEKDDHDESRDPEDDVVFGIGFGSTSKYEKKVPIRNIVLAQFAQSLRPYANVLEQELLLAIFKSSPELVADYFSKKSTFAFDPKLTATWIGYSSFLFSTIQLPVPQYLGRRLEYSSYPPPTPIVIESVLPQPLSQKVLTRCLNQTSELVTFFAVRILTVAFQKLEHVLKEFKRASADGSSLWEQASQRLVTEFCQRCPQMSVAMSAFRNTSANNIMQREAVTRLLALYYRIVPQIALNEKFDISIPLSTALVPTEGSDETHSEREVRLLEIEHLVQIARFSPNMRWWQKPETLHHSPFMTLLNLMATSAKDSHTGLKSLLVFVIREHGILQPETSPSALDALITSIQDSNGTTSNQVLDFVDDCLGRFVKRPIKYQDDLDALSEPTSKKANISHHCPFSVFTMTLLEQWIYKSSAEAKTNAIEELSQWLSRFLYLLKHIGEDELLLSRVAESMAESSKTHRKTFKTAFDSKGKEWVKDSLELVSNKANIAREDKTTDRSPLVEKSGLNGEASLELPPQEDNNHPGLNRWRQKELEENIEDGNVGELLLCLSSRHVDIRLQALTNTRQLIAKIESAKNPEWEQIGLLLNETVETARTIIDEIPMPYTATAFAVRAMVVLMDPTHFMFPKLNKFLNRGPSWNVEKLPSYWTENVLRKEPDEDDGFHKEVNWLLDLFIDCIRTIEDMEIFRARNIFERILSFYTSPICWFRIKEKILRLLFRATAVGGSTTLITRSGILSWIQAQIALKDGHEVMLKQLALRLFATCDQAKVHDWSSGSVKDMMGGLAGGKQAICNITET
ncbi:hypothetical protein AOQ84DRAFT_309448 [Glonium stellatum]|uniref:Nucleolar pre-ribosomal-associated protein 1 n=1 Tax=Glonium stellatum TaxID=574774 RepID=A0A8E2FCW9_9PEZI|nr:hypothetical protein AOQ84DRAFT_309448 [Glonium stellatum]